MAYSFGAGTTDKIDIGAALSVASRDRTFYARVKFNSVSATQRQLIDCINEATGAQWAIGVDTYSGGVTNNNIRFFFSTGNGAAYPIVNWTSGFAAGSDHVLICTYNGAQLAIYADTDATAKATLAETGTPDIPSSQGTLIGNAFSPNTSSWDGLIYEAAYWDGTALGSSDRAILGAGGSPLDCSVAPTHYWPFTADATDAVGSADGTVTGATFVGDTDTETLAPDAVLASSNLTGATLGNIDDDPAASDGSWATATSNNVTTSLRVSFPTPSAALSGDQTFRALVRKNSASGSGTPTATLSLYENGSLISADTAENVTSTTGQVISYTWSSAGRTASQIECLITGTASGGGPSVRASVDIGAVAWDATIEATGPSDETLNATPATITAQAQTATITAGSVTLTAAVATLTAQAQAATLTATAPLTITPAQITATAQTATLTPGAVSVSATPASVTAAAQSATVAASVPLPATPAQITAIAQSASISAEGGDQEAQATPATITAGAQTASISTALVLEAEPAQITAQAVSAVTAPGIAIVEGGPAALTAQAQSATLTPGSVTVEADPATLTATAQTADVTADAGDQTRNATPAEITASVPGAVLSAGAVTLTAGPATIAATAQTATSTAGEGDQTVPASPATITAEAQTATIAAGGVTLDAGPATLAASVPAAEISASVDLPASPATALFAAAVAVLVAGTVTLDGGPAQITATALSATVTGGGTLPAVSSVVGGDRAAVTVAGGDRGMVAVAGGDRGMVAVTGGDHENTDVDSGDDRAVAVTGGDRRL